LDGVSLTLQPGMDVSGSVKFDGATPPPTAQRLTQLIVALTPADGRSFSTPGLQRVGADGRFRTNASPPGRYWISVQPPSAVWTVSAITVAGADALRQPFELGTSAISDVVVTFSDHAPELS